jgi:two-component system LytT family sensor kinase
MQKHPRIRYYLLFTGCFSAFWFLFKFGGIPNLGKALSSTALDMVLNMAALVCTVEWLLPAFFYKAAYGRFALGLGLLILLGGSINIVGQLSLQGMSLFAYRASLARYKEHFFYWFWSDLVAGSYFMIAVIALGGFAIRLAFDRIATSRRLALLESDKLRSELEVLKNQINPHFIFNALNTIYYTIDASNRGARGLTEKFASLLRYQLYECNEPLVTIEKEVHCIEDYISLQKERAGKTVEVRCSGFQTLAGFSIPPHLLMPLVENCFKHVSHFPDKPNYIELSGECRGDAFLFQARNSFDPLKASHTNGIGLPLTRKRLLLLGRDSTALTTAARDGAFETTLTLHLS